ncbi:Na+/H+ antiporter NhaC family protein, partial [Salmonella enterica]|uniref:Na+/H+ antiporter NhaC family protein n=1 Tax=Salmonella enterica TaxID=28901 RepID=UPI0034A0B663
MPPFILPTLIFLFGAITSFATGSSFGTMGILIPLAIPLASAMAPNNPELKVITSASVLAGAILGDHSSPISDTTILSSMGTGSNLIDHVRTQLPYAVTVGTVAILFGYVPTALGASVWIMLPIGLIVLIAIVYTFG